MIQRERSDTSDDRLITIAVAPTQVPFSETTPRRASAARMIGSRARRRPVANTSRGRKSVGGKEARDDDQ
jgi:hypothetical protein